MPRQSLEDPPRKLTLSIPSSTLAQVEILLYDPTRMCTKYGAMSALVTAMLKRWLGEQTQNPVVNVPLTTTLTIQPEKETNNGIIDPRSGE